MGQRARVSGCTTEGLPLQIELQPVTHRLRTPLATSYGEVRERAAYLVTITTADGIVGRGEAAPLEAYDGVPLEIVGAALQRYAAVLADDRGRTGPQLLHGCRGIGELPQALGAVGRALWEGG